MADLVHRVGPHAHFRRDHVLSRNLHALAGAIELDAVIHASHGVALYAPLRKERTAMRTTIVHCNDFAAFCAVQEHVLVQEHTAQKLAVDQLVIPGAHVPAILEEHELTSSRRFAQSISERGAWEELAFVTTDPLAALVGSSRHRPPSGSRAAKYQPANRPQLGR